MLNIKTENKTYPIIIEEKVFNYINRYIDFSKFSKIVILTDENLIKKKWLEKLYPSFNQDINYIQIPSGEVNKSLKSVAEIWELMSNLKMDRKSLLINLGGGVICDIGAFCASTYMRGIDFLQIPTTLLSQVDASVGGKTGFDFNGVKNAIGTFAEPIGVIIEPMTLITLPKREYNSGMAEVIKYGIIYDREFFIYLKNENIENDYIIKRSCEIKANVVEKDFRESGLRKILNYGHTIGHAIESLSLETDLPLLHGEAVAIGMIGEAYIAREIGQISNDDMKEIENIILKYDLPTKYDGDLENIYLMLFKDKKNVGNKIKWVLPKGIGKCSFDIIVNEDIIKKAIKYILK